MRERVGAGGRQRRDENKIRFELRQQFPVGLGTQPDIDHPGRKLGFTDPGAIGATSPPPSGDPRASRVSAMVQSTVAMRGVALVASVAVTSCPACQGQQQTEQTGRHLQ